MPLSPSSIIWYRTGQMAVIPCEWEVLWDASY